MGFNVNKLNNFCVYDFCLIVFVFIIKLCKMLKVFGFVFVIFFVIYVSIVKEYL